MYLEIYSLFVSGFVYVACGSFEHFEQLSHFRSHSCWNGSLFTQSAVSVVECTWFCIKHGTDCKGVSFPGASGPCHGCSADSLLNLDSEADGFIYKRVSTCIHEDVNTVTALSIIPNNPMCPTVILTVDNGYTDIGEWYLPEVCPLGTYAIGVNLKEEEGQFLGGDDTAINSVELECSSPNGSVQGGYITSGDAGWGNWLESVYCDPGHVLKAYRIRVGNSVWHPISEDPEYAWAKAYNINITDGDDDRAGITNLRVKCGEFFTNVDMEILDMNVKNRWGNWGSWSVTCGPGKGICGLRGRIQGDQGPGDDTALNDLVTYCC